MSVSIDRSAFCGAARGRRVPAQKASPTGPFLKRRRLAAVAVLLAALLLQTAPTFASSTDPAPPAPTPVPSKGPEQGNWQTVTPTLYGRLFGVYAVAPNDIWAVGSKVLIATTGTLIMHYDGSAWTEVTSIPWVRNAQRLNAVMATGPADAWAVGAEGPKTIALHWDGANWNPTDAAPPAPAPLPTPTPHCQAVFTDVGPDQNYYPFVNYLYCRGVIQGYEDGTFRPENPVTRGQLAKMVVGAFDLHSERELPRVQHFSDVPPASPFFFYIEAAYSRGLISGYADGTFHPQELVTRGQLAKVVTIAASMRDPDFWQAASRHEIPGGDGSEGAFSDVPPGSPFYPYVETAAGHNAITGYNDGTYRPQTNTNRAEVATVLYMAIFSAPAYSLNGVVSLSPTNTWAAGTDGVNPLVMHYNGTTWEHTALPAPVGINGRLSDIKMTPSGLFAVGSYSTALPDPNVPPLTIPDRSSHSLLFKYDPQSGEWVRKAVPGSSLPASTLLSAASVGGSAWAVGASESTTEGVMSPMALTSGRPPSQWSLLTPPAEDGGTTLASVAGSGSGDIWTAGWSGTAFSTLPSARMYAAHYDGASWDLAALPDLGTSSRLMSIFAVSANDVWTVGYSGQGPTTLPVILHYTSASGDHESKSK